MNETFGERFTRLRKQKGFTQDDVAEKLNISPQAVSKWENDINLPDIGLLNEISEILEVTIDELLGKISKTKADVSEQKSIDKMMLKIKFNDRNTKMNINIPVIVIKTSLELGLELPKIKGSNEALSSIDFKYLFSLIEKGIIGELINIDLEDTKIVIVVE